MNREVQQNPQTGAARGKEGGPSPRGREEILREFAELLYKKTSFYETGDRKLFERVLELQEIYHKTFINSIGWKVTWSIRQDGKNEYARYVIVRKWPLEPGNIYEETLLFRGGKPLPEDAYV
jgi:hypothetical protein